MFKKVTKALRAIEQKLDHTDRKLGDIAKQEKLDKTIQQLDKISQQLEKVVQHSGRPYPRVSGWLDTPPNSNLGLFKAISELAMARTVEIVQTEMPDAMIFYETDPFLKYALAKASKTGAHAEFGVYSGRTINLFATERPDVIFDGFDSFEGLPEEWSGWQVFDFDRGGALPDVSDNVKLYKGWFSETVPFYASTIKTLSFVHIDCDIYSSTNDVFVALEHKIEPGCVIVFDEYFCYPNFEKHERLAFSEFLARTGLHAHWFAVCGQRTACILRDVKS